jgi:Putative auto-transporter adhesin, head GIN domain
MKRMNKLSSVLLSALALVIGGCDWEGIRGNGHIVTDQRQVSAFSEIDASGALQIEWRSGAPALSIITDQNLLSHVENENAGNRLRLSSHGNLWPTHGVKIVISSPSRDGAKLSGATRFIANQLSGRRFAIESSGAARVLLDGKIDELLADMTGASRLEAQSLQSKTAEISTTGAGHAEVAVTDTLKVSITGAGKVIYSGNPKSIEKHVTGAGSIHHKD